MPEVSRPSKRIRSSPEGDEETVGLPQSASLGNPTHDEEFWLEDGNIVLISRNTAFRIYRGLLSAQSSIFADMFTAASSRADESYEGCPVIHLSESPEDLRHFLRVLLPKSQRTFVSDGSQTTVSFDQIFAVVRLSHKYQVDDILQQAMTYLKTYCTTCPGHWTGPTLFTLLTHGIGAVNLAILTETPAILPRALLDCASLGSIVLDGWEREDGSVEHLSDDHLKLVLDARDRLIMEAFYVLKKVFGGMPDAYCEDWEACQKRRRELLLKGMDMGNSAFDPKSIFSSWESLVDEDREGPGVLCTACVDDIGKHQENVLADLWRGLPAFFHLNIPGWPESL